MTAFEVSAPEFRDALGAAEPGRLAVLPKADRHCHSLLGASLRSISEWAGVAIPAAPPRMTSFEDMREYLHRELYPHIRNRAGFEFTAGRSIEESVLDGVRILEMSIDVDFLRFYDGPEEFFRFVRGLVERHRDAIGFRPELGISKNRPPAEQSQMVPVRGERETTERRAAVGAGVPQSGPTAKMSGMAGSKGSRRYESRMRRTPRPLPPR